MIKMQILKSDVESKVLSGDRRARITVDPANASFERQVTVDLRYEGDNQTRIPVKRAKELIFVEIDKVQGVAGRLATPEGWKKVMDLVGDLGADIWKDNIERTFEDVKLKYSIDFDRAKYAFVGAKVQLEGEYTDPLNPKPLTASLKKKAKTPAYSSIEGILVAELNQDKPKTGDIKYIGNSLNANVSLHQKRTVRIGTFEFEIGFDLAADSLFDRVRQNVTGEFSWDKFKAIFDEVFADDDEILLKIRSAFIDMAVFGSEAEAKEAGYALLDRSENEEQLLTMVDDFRRGFDTYTLHMFHTLQQIAGRSISDLEANPAFPAGTSLRSEAGSTVILGRAMNLSEAVIEVMGSDGPSERERFLRLNALPIGLEPELVSPIRNRVSLLR